MHEYAHFLTEHSTLKLPLWLNEGLAEFYSSLEIEKDQAVLGKAIPEHLAMLRRSPG